MRHVDYQRAIIQLFVVRRFGSSGTKLTANVSVRLYDFDPRFTAHTPTKPMINRHGGRRVLARCPLLIGERVNPL